MDTIAIPEKMVSFVACAGSAAGKTRFGGYPTCEAAVKSGFARGECMSGCVGVGDCVTVCLKGALRRVNGRVTVDREKCDGCGDCCDESVCPQHLIRLVPADATNYIPCSSTQTDEELTRTSCDFGCVACGECQRICPVDAITIETGHAVIDYDKCVGCMACAAVCRKQIILDAFHNAQDLKSTVAYIRCAGDPSAAELKKGTTCRDAARQSRAGACRSGCLGCGDCVAACRFGAISVANGVAVVDAELCTGCKDCARACPQELIAFLPLKGVKQIPCAAGAGDGRQCKNACTLCGTCIENCPEGAVYVEASHAVIDPELCVDCGLCISLCPQHAVREITVQSFIEIQQQAFSEQEGAL